VVALDAGDQLSDRSRILVIDDARRALPPAAVISSPVSSIVSGRPISDGPAVRLLRPVA
jgi:hypothetical protein